MTNLKKYIRTSIQRTYINFREWARENNIFHQFIKLESEIYGFVYRSSGGNYYILINKNLTRELQNEVFLHEVEHIVYDMPEVGYIIGLDMQYSPMEKQTNKWAQLVAENKAGYFFG